MTTPATPGARSRRAAARRRLRACRTTSWPSPMRTPAAARPSPSVEPVMKMRGTGIILPPVVCWYRSAALPDHGARDEVPQNRCGMVESAGCRLRVTSCARPGSGRGGEAVAGAAHRLQGSGTVSEFAAQGADHDLDDVAAAAPVIAPYVAQQRRPADDPAFAFAQVLQDVEFELR